MGGAIAAAFASTFPTKINTVTFISSAGTPSMTRNKLVWDGVLPLLLRLPWVGEKILHWMMTASDADEWLDSNTDRFRRYQADLQLRLRVEHALPRSICLTLLGFPLGDMVDAFEAIGQHGTPTLVIWGAKDGVVHPDGAREITSFVPHARLCMHPSAGHALPIELSEYCAKNINDFHSDVGDGTPR